VFKTTIITWTLILKVKR